MKTSDNTILITGGASGTGLELAKLLSAMGNQVIITGKNKILLNRISSENGNIATLFCDTACEKDVDKLIYNVRKKFPALNVFINNAGQSYLESEEYLLAGCPDHLLSQYLSGIRITEELLPLFEIQENATVIDASLLTLGFVKNSNLITSIRAIAGSYYKLLRHKLKGSGIEVPDLQGIALDENSNPAMIAFRLIETMYNTTPVLRASDSNDYAYINTLRLSKKFINNHITN